MLRPLLPGFLYLWTHCSRHLSVQDQYRRLWSCPSSSCYNGSPVTWTVVCLTTAKFMTLIFSASGFVLPDVNCHGFVWRVLVASIILLYNHICTEAWKPCANCEPVCSVENFQWCRELYFAGAAILVNGFLLLWFWFYAVLLIIVSRRIHRKHRFFYCCIYSSIA
jgi:hypothetical protein